MDLNRIEDFDNLEVRGNVTWESFLNQNDRKGSLNYFIENVVTTIDDQIISGPVTFEKDVVINNVNGKWNVNDEMDLSFIANDAILKTGNEQVMMTSFV